MMKPCQLGSWLLNASVLAGVSLLSACGGSGSDDAASTAPAGRTAQGLAAASGAAGGTGVSGSSTSLDDDDVTAEAPVAATEDKGSDGGALGVATVVAPEVAPMRSRSSVPADIGAVYYVDSRLGSDSNDGRAESGSGGVGPWKSIEKLAGIAFAPGDVIRLVCGSVWARTLTLSVSGTADKPITVASHPANCKSPPVIDGSLAIAPASWKPYSGSIYRTALTFAPQQLKSEGSQLNPAHHPNQGYDAALPNSIYARNAADSDNVLIDGVASSTYLTVGTDLVLPPGASIPAGTKIRMRTNSWTIDESVVSAVSGARLYFTKPSSYPLKAGWGYFLMGQLWMLDSPGEWYYDPIGKYLYAWMPDSKAPSSKVKAGWLTTGIDLRGKQYIQIDGLTIRMVGTGVNMRDSTGVAIRNVRIEDTVGMGIDAAASVSGVIESNLITRAGRDAISGTDNSSMWASGLRIANNRITSSGVIMRGEVMIGLPSQSYAAIRAGMGAQVTGNSVQDAGNMGIFPMGGSVVSANFVSGACSSLDDCGGIYASGVDNGSTISGNIVVHSRGSALGKPASIAYTQAKGIYLDEYASGVQIIGNTVVDTDEGIHLHNAAANTIKDNKLYGNRNYQIWLQEGSNKVNPSGDIFGNRIENNQIVSTSPTAVGVYQSTSLVSTVAFGTYDLNRYFDSVYATISAERTPARSTAYALPTWKVATTDSGESRNLDPNGSGTSQLKYATSQTTGTNVIANGNFATSLAGWTTWNATSPYGTVVRQACTPGFCATYTAGASPGMLSTPFFAVEKDQWYRISFDMQASTDNQYQPVVVRRGGGGTADYASVSDVNMFVTAGKNWKRYSFIFRATSTVIVNDPATGGKGARMDFEQVQPGTKISVGNVEMVPISSVSATTRTDILVNASASPVEFACPVSVSAPDLCSKYVRFTDTKPLTWPYYTPAKSAEIIYTLDASLVDSDGDGVPDVQDKCAATPVGSAVNAAGCELGR